MEKKSINFGFVGYSDVPNEMIEKKMKEKITYIFSIIERQYCNEKYQDYALNIISGATDCGISKFVYEEAERFNAEYGLWFTLIGVMAKEGYNYKLYPCDQILAIGEKFGEESEFFINEIDILYKVGGGKQSQKEFEMAKNKGIPCYEYEVSKIN